MVQSVPTRFGTETETIGFEIVGPNVYEKIV